LVQVKELLRALADPEALPGVPDSVRAQATALLRHYPTLVDLKLVHDAVPDLFGPPPPFSRMRGNPQTDAVLDAATTLSSSQRGRKS